jgi:hypothetical protein
MPSHRLEDHETPTVEAAAGFERYHAFPDWDESLAREEARREPAERDPWEQYQRRLRGGDS